MTANESVRLDDREVSLRRLFARMVFHGAGDAESRRSGWSSPVAQERACGEFLSHVDDEGSVIDLGCGDGRLLQYICEHSEHELEPHGVDFLDEAIEAARRRVWPGIRGRFVVDDVTTFDPGDVRFTFVITSPCYVAARIRSFHLNRIDSMVEPGGRLILYEYFDSEGSEGLITLCERSGLQWSKHSRTDLVEIVTVDHPTRDS